MVRRN